MSRQVSAAEAKNHLGDFLRDAESGEVVLITRYGKPVAALVSADDAARLERLKATTPQSGLVGLVGMFDDSEELVAALDKLASHKSPPAPPPKLGV